MRVTRSSLHCHRPVMHLQEYEAMAGSYFPPRQGLTVLGLRNDALPCPVCSDYICHCHAAADTDTPAVVQPLDDGRSWMTAWCEAAAANA